MTLQVLRLCLDGAVRRGWLKDNPGRQVETNDHGDGDPALPQIRAEPHPSRRRCPGCRARQVSGPCRAVTHVLPLPESLPVSVRAYEKPCGDAVRWLQIR
jgi:hypothetical protein